VFSITVGLFAVLFCCNICVCDLF